MSKPRVLFLVTQALGWKTYALHLEKQLARQDKIEGILHRVPTKLPEKVFRRLNILDGFKVTSACWKSQFEAWVEHSKPDHVHCATQSLALHWANRSPVIPFSLMIDATRSVCDRDDFAASTSSQIALEKEMFEKASLVAGLSHWAVDSAVQDYNTPSEKTFLMPPSLEVPDQLARMSAIPPRIVFIGGDFVRKGGDKLLRWHHEHFQDAELHIVGPKSPGGFEIGPNVVWHGWTPNEVVVKDILPSARVLVHPTQKDMSGWVIAEAAALGIPAISSITGGVPDLIDDRVTGFLHRPTDEDGFISSIRSLLENPQQAAEMGDHAYDKVNREMNADINFPLLFERIAETC